jgi:hypothetical protein
MGKQLVNHLRLRVFFFYQMFEDTKEVIKSRKPNKGIQNNMTKKKLTKKDEQ